MNITHKYPPARSFRAGLFLFVVLVATCAMVSGGCGDERGSGPEPGEEGGTIRPIDAVLNEHAPEFMKIDGVVGIYAGALDNGAASIVVMLRDDGPLIKKQIPEMLEGYPVRVEIGGEIRPLGP